MCFVVTRCLPAEMGVKMGLLSCELLQINYIPIHIQINIQILRH